MCRMLMFRGRYQEKYWELFDALIKAAERDHILGKYKGKEYGQHPDGWGIAIIYHDTRRYMLYKSLNPIFEEKDILKRLLNRILWQEVSIIAHVRNAGTLRKNIESVHPFLYITNLASTIFVAHNGILSRSFFGKELMLDKAIIENVCDSHLFAMWIAKKWSSLKDALNELITKNVVKSALNAFIIELSNTKMKPTLYAISYLNEEYLRKSGETNKRIEILREYYYIYYYVDEIAIFASSTIADYITGIPRDHWKILRLDGELCILNESVNIVSIR